jgi:chromosome segregation ATPase
MSPNEIIYALQSGTAKIAELNELLKADRAELARLRAEVEAFKNNNRYHRGHSAGYAEAKDDYTAELTRLRAEVGEKEMQREQASAYASTVTAENVALRAEVERLNEKLRIESAASAHALHWAEKAEAELANIANAKPDTWGDMSDSFKAWAQNRARHALAAMKGTP